MHRIEFQAAYILHTRPYRETSLLIEVFTLDYGRMAVIAKGIRKPKIGNRGLLQPFVPLLVSCVGRGELLVLKEFEMADRIHFIEGQRLISAFYVNELLMRLLHRWDPHPDLFQLYKETLMALEKQHTQETTDFPELHEQIILRTFEKSLLKTLGYALQLVKEFETNDPVCAEKWYLFYPERGPVLVEQVDWEQPKQSNLLYPGKSLLALAGDKLNPEDPSIIRDAKRIMRQALAPHLGGKPLETRRLFIH